MLFLPKILNLIPTRFKISHSIPCIPLRLPNERKWLKKKKLFPIQIKASKIGLSRTKRNPKKKEKVLNQTRSRKLSEKTTIHVLFLLRLAFLSSGPFMNLFSELFLDQYCCDSHEWKVLIDVQTPKNAKTGRSKKIQNRRLSKRKLLIEVGVEKKSEAKNAIEMLSTCRVLAWSLVEWNL